MLYIIHVYTCNCPCNVHHNLRSQVKLYRRNHIDKVKLHHNFANGKVEKEEKS